MDIYFDRTNQKYKLTLNGGPIPCGAQLCQLREEIIQEIDKLLDLPYQFVNKYNADWEAAWEKMQRGDPKPVQKIKHPGHVYILKSNGKFKIGRAKNLDQRVKQYRTENPFGAEVLFSVKCEDFKYVEQEALKMPLCAPTAGREWFELSEKEVDEIIKFLKTNEIQT